MESLVQSVVRGLVTHAVQDSVVVESPLPGGAATLVRFFLQVVPQWLQIGGALLGAVVALIVASILWKRRLAIVESLKSQNMQLKVAFGVATALLLVGAVTAGAVSWDYMQHDNDFCAGCHVMDTAFFKFEESEHDSLSCHDCHQQSIFASARQLYLWVAERPEEIGEHAPVANTVCETCHVTGEPEVWRRIASTAGHRTHLEADSLEVMCVTCHGQEVHRFAPVDQTCGQSGCHVSGDTDIAIGAMQQQTALHCTTCHQFVVDVPQLATLDSAASAMTPDFNRCTSCHEMQAVLDDFDPALDPHQGTCGTCHNPHAQSVAADAAATCTTSGCHDNWQIEPFHTGTSHLNVGERCLVCHEPHQARVDASDCTGCHTGIIERTDVPAAVRDRLRRVAPFDTSAALRGSGIDLSFDPRSIRSPPTGLVWAAGVMGPQPLLSLLQAPVAPPDSFEHDKHANLSCLTCHQTALGHGPLNFEAPRGCQICHHQAPEASECGDCHLADELGSVTATVTVSVEGSPDRNAAAVFLHSQHDTETCVTCHVSPVSMAVPQEAATCSDCHETHHKSNVACVQCHQNDRATLTTAHQPPNDAHAGCDECHAAATVERLFPDEQFCATCHELSPQHPEAARSCTECHFLVSPEEFQKHLVGTEVPR